MIIRALLAVATLSVRDAWAVSQVTCKDPSVTWYNNADGLNPCQQYEALRRLCDANYEVPVLSTFTPGDRCDSQLHDCCCNSIAFTLSMECLNCQQGVGSGRPPDTGIDAGATAYQIYLDGCGAGTNQSLPETTQLAVCHTGLHLSRYMYELFWGDGSWFLEFTRQTATLEAQSGTDDPGKCGTTSSSTTSSSTTAPTSSSSSTSPPSATSDSSATRAASSGSAQAGDHAVDPSSGGKGSATAAIVGGTLGGAVAVVLLIALFCYLLKRRRTVQPQPPPPHPPQDMYDARPYTGYSGTAGSVTTGPSIGQFYVPGHGTSASFSHSNVNSDLSSRQYQQQQQHIPRPPSTQLPQYEYTQGSGSDIPPVPERDPFEDMNPSFAAARAHRGPLDLAAGSPSTSPHTGLPLLSGGPARGDAKVRVPRRDPPNSPPGY